MEANYRNFYRSVDLRLLGIVEIVPISKSTWLKGASSGRFPAPVELGSGIACWKESGIEALVGSGSL